MSLNWFTRSNNPNEPLCIGERVGYSCANTGIAVSYVIILCFMSYYYTDVVGIPAGVVGTIMLVSRIFDGISDLLMGWVVDKTRTKIGKCRPWLLITAIPHAAMCAIAFAVPAGWPDAKKYVYVFITYNLLNAVTYTMSNIPVWAANCLLTDNSEEHAKSGVWMQIGGCAALFAVQYTFLSVVAKLGDDNRAWTSAAAIYAGVGAVLMIISGLTIRERVITTAEEIHIPLKRRISALFTNRYWVLYTLTWCICAIVETLVSSGCIYYAKYILGKEDAFASIASLQSVVQTIVLLLAMTFLIKKLGNVRCTIWCFVLYAAASIVQMITLNWVAILICSAAKGVGMAMFLGAQGGIMADVCSYGSKKAGFDISGIGNAGINFGSKFGMGIASVLLGWVMELFGYDGTLTVQSAGGILGVKMVYLIIPIIVSAIGILLMLPFDMYKCHAESNLTNKMKDD